jgi:two-component system, OmpR family, response regulator MprA
MQHTVLVVEDDAAVRESLVRALGQDGYAVETAADGHQALSAVAAKEPDVVVLDVGLPGIDGLAVCRRYRADGRRTPVLMLTARDGISDRVAGLDAGADDYLVKPFALAELLARLRALLRRAEPLGATAPLQFADLVMEPSLVEVRRGARRIELTRTEYQLLELFLRNPRRVLTRAAIFTHVWGYDFGEGSNSLDVYIGYLRRKLEADGQPRLIQTVRGFGYALRQP